MSARRRSALSFAALTASALVALFLVYAVGFGTSLGTAIDPAAIQAPDPALSPRVRVTTDRLIGTVSVGPSRWSGCSSPGWASCGDGRTWRWRPSSSSSW